MFLLGLFFLFVLTAHSGNDRADRTSGSPSNDREGCKFVDCRLSIDFPEKLLPVTGKLSNLSIVDRFLRENLGWESTWYKSYISTSLLDGRLLSQGLVFFNSKACHHGRKLHLDGFVLQFPLNGNWVEYQLTRQIRGDSIIVLFICLPLKWQLSNYSRSSTDS